MLERKRTNRTYSVMNKNTFILYNRNWLRSNRLLKAMRISAEKLKLMMASASKNLHIFKVKPNKNLT
ncbi:hypothetical protein SAMN02799630_03168 [Paenibacillus sp. UNCCL117]|nr:hypothetical protein SAMN04488602_11516 [Paenibacillus sp. cl123]SFW44153.1 hypothetical protein SAMN02799630_03168 [Paenibacillus sp. UNCCL117]